jgi:hypothetical protein
MAERARKAGIALRPHIKTHKTPIIAHLQMKAGAIGITCAKLGEAEVMAASGIGDIFIAYPIVGQDKIERLLNLARWVPNVSTSVDTLQAARALNDAAITRGQCLNVIVEVDTGYRRTGVEPCQPLVQFVKEIVISMPGLHYKDLNRAIFNCICNIAGLEAGYQGEGMKTVIPARATAKVDFRLIPDQDPDDIFVKLQAHLDREGFTDVSAVRVGAMKPYKAPANDQFVILATRTAVAVYQHTYRINPLLGGSSPIYAFAGPLGGIPVIWAGIGYSDNRAHSPNEHIRLADFLSGARHIAYILNDFPDLTNDSGA